MTARVARLSHGPRRGTPLPARRVPPPRSRLGRVGLALVTGLALLVAGPTGASALTPAAEPTTPATNDPGGAGSVKGTVPDLDTLIEQLRDELGESSEEMLRAGASLRLAEAALPLAKRNAAQARRLLTEAMRRQERTARLRGQAQVRLILAEQAAEASAAAVTAQRARIGALARAAYQGGGSFTEISMLLDARSPSDFASRMASLRTLAAAQRSVLGDLETVEASYGEELVGLEALRDGLAEADKQAQRELAAVMSLESQARAAEETVARLVAEREAALAAARAAQAADDAAAAHRETASGKLSGVLGARARAEAGPGGARDGAAVTPEPGALTWPVTGRLSSPFGMRVHPITGVYKLHTGQDIAAACGTGIRAVRAGEVIEAGWNAAYGWRTVISHGVVKGALLTSTYNHQQGLGVEVGQQVAAGEVIGQVGSTGYSTGCHLHLELYVNASLVDPARWLP